MYISTRSGAWVIPSYMFGFPTDLYACRAFFLLPWRWGSFILESVIKFISGNPNRYLNYASDLCWSGIEGVGG